MESQLQDLEMVNLPQFMGGCVTKSQTEQDDRPVARLLDVLASEDDRLMVAIADNYGNLNTIVNRQKERFVFI